MHFIKTRFKQQGYWNYYGAVVSLAVRGIGEAKLTEPFQLRSPPL